MDAFKASIEGAAGKSAPSASPAKAAKKIAKPRRKAG
jgi:hypothetical protein